MQPRVSRSEYEEWRSSLVTEQLFNFFKLERELLIQTLSGIDMWKPNEEIGEEYFRRRYAAECYRQLASIDYEDLFPEEGNDEGSKEA
jgi:hypothetical protein